MLYLHPNTLLINSIRMKHLFLLLIMCLATQMANAQTTYSANFLTTDLENIVGYQENKNFTLGDKPWFVNRVYKNDTQFRPSCYFSTILPACFGGEKGVYVEMKWDMANINKISLTCTQATGDAANWSIYESIDAGTNWQPVATGTDCIGKWEYSTYSPQTSARYAFVVKGTSAATMLSDISIETQATNHVHSPTFSLPSGTYYEPQQVTLSSPTAEADIYYTLDNSTPTTNSTPYSEAIQIDRTTQVKAIAHQNGVYSETTTANYTLKLNPPQALEASLVSSMGFTAHWESVARATGYKLYVTNEGINTDPGNGTSERPYTVAALLNSSTEVGAPISIRGYIVGEGYKNNNKLDHRTNASFDLVLAIADSTTNFHNLSAVHLSAPLRDEWGPKSNPDKLGMYIEATGVLNFSAYKTPIVYNATSIEQSTPTADNNINGSPFAATSEASELEVNTLQPEETYKYHLVATAEGYSDSEASNTIIITTKAATSTILNTTSKSFYFDGRKICNPDSETLHIYNIAGQNIRQTNSDIEISTLINGLYIIHGNNQRIKIVVNNQ